MQSQLAATEAKPATRSSLYYFDEKFITIRVEDVLYKIPTDIIKNRSQVFTDMLTIPVNTSTMGGEGQCDEQPIYLHGHSSKDFDCLMKFFFDGEKPEVSLDFLSSLLKLSDFFIIEDGQRYALLHLEGHPELDLATKLQFCQRYKLETWLEPAFRELMHRQMDQISGDEADCIPRRIYHTFVTTQNEITRHRLSLGYKAPPAVNYLLCDTPATCCYNWKQAWNDGPAKMFNHLDHYYLVSDVLEALRTTDVPYICKDCYRLSVNHVENSDELREEGRIFERKVEELKGWLRDL